jgi:hypothetical protein
MGDDPELECFLSCISKSPAAQQLDSQMEACYGACGDTDDACFNKCDQQFDAACSQNAQACQVIDQCAGQCFEF